jgi:hypothetical protein
MKKFLIILWHVLIMPFRMIQDLIEMEEDYLYKKKGGKH